MKLGMSSHKTTQIPFQQTNLVSIKNNEKQLPCSSTTKSRRSSRSGK